MNTCMIDIYCGLLGCGKTTLIRRLLETEYVGRKVAIIENEIGKVNLDSRAFDRTSVSVSPMTGGCVCCTFQGEFAHAVEIITDREQPDVIIIEPTGTADIRGIYEALSNVDSAKIRRCIMVVNAKKLVKLLKVIGPFYEEQLSIANCIYLNFTETLGASDIDAAKACARSKNDKAIIVDTKLADITADTFSDIGGALLSSKSLRAQNIKIIPLDESDAGHMQIHRPGQTVLYTYTLVIKTPLTEDMYNTLLNRLRDTDHMDLWRAKGIIPMADGSSCRIDICFGDKIETPISEPDTETLGKIVLIGSRIKPEFLSKNTKDV